MEISKLRLDEIYSIMIEFSTKNRLHVDMNVQNLL